MGEAHTRDAGQARPKAWVVVGIGGLLLAAGVAAWALTRVPDDGPVRRLTIAEPWRHWEDEGFVEMVPPVRLPTATPGADDVAIWLRIPEGGVIETRRREGDAAGGAAGEATGEEAGEAASAWILAFPPGTIADRVESRGRGGTRGVIDVRGTELAEAGEEWMHTLRRDGGAKGGLFGYEWPRSSTAAHAEATRLLLAELAEIPPGSSMSEEARAGYLSRIQTKNQCVTCHVHGRADNRREGERGVVNRGTDGSGFFTPQTVLLDEIPLERYGTIDPNLRDPWVTLRCPEGEAKLESKKGRLLATCPDNAVPVGRFDLDKALSHGDERAERICAARRYLYAHLDERGREVFSPAISACEKD
ncbi:hypothetical protein G6O69_05570 [Pseudenhygromyxa sp. WMMC2535]|uniref:hypothetical protein n=1 Tax=Pseudenhygromyxa sp. WMMC2535 TaxID=2712867 RepID=UPI001556EB6E|nr:hypothetical protein [Pseudenhygromyxa sp. WMMC2535]NVB37290.1 hypothetical protein [Pseudenhygromyxa sp. WMMC2535]